MWLNEYDIEEAVERIDRDDYPNLAKGAETLDRLMRWVDRNSDGWPHWRAPAKASANLGDLVYSWRQRYIKGDTDITGAELTTAYRPIKAFLTRQGVDHEVIFPTPQQQ